MDYSVGDTIVYYTFGGLYRTVVVTYRDEDIKNGHPGFDGVMVDTGEDVWGYDDQIVEVL